MKLAAPRTLAGQTLLVLLLGLAVSHVIGFAVYSLDRHEVVASTEAIDFAERIAGVISLLQKLPEQWREDLIRGSDSRAFRVVLDSTPTAISGDPKADVVADVIQYLTDLYPGWSDDQILASLIDGESDPAVHGLTAAPESTTPRIEGAAVISDQLLVSIGLEDGQWLNFQAAITRIESSWPRAAGAYILSIAIGIGALMIWLVSRVTAPLSTFAQAADRFGKNLRAEPLPVVGPIEVAQASEALNYMQQRLSRLIDNRTHMLAAISHDLRTPVTLLRLRAELMSDSEEKSKVLETLEDMESMITAVLEFSRGAFSDEQQRHVDLGALLESLCDDLTDMGAPIAFVPPPLQVLYSCRRVALKRAFSNLIDNAIKYGKRAVVTIEETGDEIDVTVDDDGPGIPEEHLEHVFKPFYRVDSSRGRGAGGVGLGLSTAQAIIQGHGGTIRIENRADGGTRVRVSLPR